MGEYILSHFQKIEEALEDPGSKLSVNLAIVMDGSNNSVRTLWAFAAQNKYHYIPNREIHNVLARLEASGRLKAIYLSP